MTITAVITDTASLLRQPITFICPHCRQYVRALCSDAQLMVHFVDSACHFCDHLLTHGQMISQVQAYVAQHFAK